MGMTEACQRSEHQAAVAAYAATKEGAKLVRKMGKMGKDFADMACVFIFSGRTDDNTIKKQWYIYICVHDMLGYSPLIFPKSFRADVHPGEINFTKAVPGS